MKNPNPPRWHQLDEDALGKAARQLRRSAQPGIDGVTAKDYIAELDERVKDLHTRLHAGAYVPQPLLDMWIPKGPGETRHVQVLATEDKVVECAALNIIEPIFETRFLSCSYGCRPKLAAHHAVGSIRRYIARWAAEDIGVLKADISNYFGNIHHETLMSFLSELLVDPRLLDLISRILSRASPSGIGIAQGGVITPFLANVYLDTILDFWLLRRHARRADLELRLVRFVDDFVVLVPGGRGLESLHDDISARLSQFGLTLHPKKTTLTTLGARHEGEFEALGFGFRLKPTDSGALAVAVRTSPHRLTEALSAWRVWLKKSRRLGRADRLTCLRNVALGHVDYYGLPENRGCVLTFLRRASALAERHAPDLVELQEVLSDLLASPRKAPAGVQTWSRATK